MNEERLFHIGITKSQGAKYAILPGDPGRVKLIAAYLDQPCELASNREFTSFSGKLCGERVIVMSTGIGGPSAAIALEELCEAGLKYAIRTGTCGGISEGVIPGDIIIPTAAVRMEGTSREYAPLEFPAAADFGVVKALSEAAEKNGFRVHTGIVQSKDSFYGQHSPETMPVEYRLKNKWSAWKRLGVLASEMETAALYTVAAARGIKVGCVLHALWNQERKNKGYVDDDDFDLSAAIKTAVEAMKLIIAADRKIKLPDEVPSHPASGLASAEPHTLLTAETDVHSGKEQDAPVKESCGAEDPDKAEQPAREQDAPAKESTVTAVQPGTVQEAAPREQTGSEVAEPVTERPRKKMIAVVGPTASGKTDLAIKLAKVYNGEIVSADSMQIYKGMEIASAKPTEEEMQGVPHHLMSFISPSDTFSVSDYVRLASEAIDDIISRGKMPILCGGSGLYIRSLIDNITFAPDKPDERLREQLNERYEKEGGEALLEELREFDPETAEKLSANDGKRIIRAIEIYRSTGITMSQHVSLSKLEPSPYDVTAIGLTFADRQNLYDRINRRVDAMLERGLIKEAECFYSSEKSITSSAAIGYKELKPYLDGRITLEAAAEKLKMESRRYSKRQMTWFRRDEYIKWIEVDKCDDVLAEAERIINEADKKEA